MDAQSIKTQKKQKLFLKLLKNSAMSNDELGTLIQKYRKTHKLSQTEFALMFGVSQPTVGTWETGFYGPSGSKRDAIVKLVSGKKEEKSQELTDLRELVQSQKSIIELLKDKLKGLGGLLYGCF